MHSFSVSKKAQLGSRVTIGYGVVIEDDVQIGDNNKIENYVLIKKGTVIGSGNTICGGAQLGVLPQDYHFRGEVSQCVIGDNNIVREYTTISRATGENNKTIIGNNNFIMSYVHIAHNIIIGNNTVIASGSQLGGYVFVDDFVNIGGLSGVHQFCRIGKYAMLGAKSYLNRDLMPYLLARGNQAKICGVNIRGLRVNSFSHKEIRTVQKLYSNLFNSQEEFSRCVNKLAKQEIGNPFYSEIAVFIKNTKRGILLSTEV